MASQAPGTGLAIFDPKAAVPAHVAQFFDEVGTNIQPKTTVPSLSPEGKTWTIAIDGTKTKMQRRNADGDLEPLPIMKVVILDFNKNRGRAYYEGDYDPNNVSAPICWSDDGVTPDDSLPGPFAAGTAIEPGTSRKISAACANCPMAVKGSKVDSIGKARTACAQHKMVAVYPDPQLGLPAPLVRPLRLKLAMTSIWDNQSPDQEQQGWLSFDRYVDYINARGIKHTAALVTKMKFDPQAAFPKIFFAGERHLEAQEMAVIAPLTHDEDTKKLLGGTWTPAGVDGVPKNQQTVATPQGSEPVAEVPPQPATEYRMADGETHTREQFHQSGWTDEQLIAAGKLIAVTPAPAAPEVVATPVAPPAPAAPAAQEAAVVVVGEPAATAVEPTATAVAASPPATAEVVVGEPAPAQTSAPSQPAAPPPNQEPAQAAAPAPSPAPVAPEPPAAAAAAATVTAEVSTELPPDLAKIMGEWT
jgi:hypothetical protein